MDDDRRRAPSEFRKIEDVEEDDIRVSVIGTIVDMTESKVVLDDGTGKIEASFDLSKDLGEFEEGDMARVMGRPTGNKLEGEIIQDFEGFDVDLYQETLEKVNELRE